MVQARAIRLRIPSGTILRILTNDLTAPAQEIADLYRPRWGIELFFRRVNQTLRIKRFLGTLRDRRAHAGQPERNLTEVHHGLAFCRPPIKPWTTLPFLA